MRARGHVRAMIGPDDVRWYGARIEDKEIVKSFPIGDPRWSRTLNCWITTRWATQPLRDRLIEAGYTVALVDVTVVPPPSEAFMATRKPTVTYNADGWPDPNRPPFKLCGTQTTHGCTAPPVWKTERKHRGYVATAYRCDDHLDAADRDAALAAAAERLAAIRESGTAA